MTYRHFLGAIALFVSVSTAITGCAKQHQPKGAAEEQPQQVERISQLAQTDPAQASVDEPKHTDLNVSSGKTEDILAQKTQSYAEEVERLFAARAAEKAAAMKQQQQQQQAQQGTVASVPTAAAKPTTKPAPTAANSEVVFADPKHLAPAPTAHNAPGKTAPTAANDQKPTIHQLLDTAPATANQATHIPAAGESIPAAAVTTPVVEIKPAPAGAQSRLPVAGALPTDALAQKLGERIKADPLDVAAHVDYQLLQMLNDQSVPALDVISPLPQEDREIVSAVMDGLSNFRNGIRNGGNALLSQKVGPLVDMADRIRSQTTLTIPSLVLCRDVKQYGVYQPFENTRFPLGEKHPVVVYCEVANFVSQLNSRSLWETKLKYEVLLYTDSDKALQVWQQKSTPVVDQSHSRRRDFFIAKLLELPQDLPIGGYLMKVSIIDDTANRIAEATVPLQIVAK
ncbi:MAG: hypothetical protein M3478_15200 [Planctomycetota bacterium]|nr:hypothetical protein [Planctomycetota bacterium]